MGPDFSSKSGAKVRIIFELSKFIDKKIFFVTKLLQNSSGFGKKYYFYTFF